MPVPSTATIDLTNQDDRVQPLRYMELGINLNEWEKSTLTAEERLRYKFEITNTANPHDNHYFESWYVNIADDDLNGVKQYCKLYQSPSSTAKDDVIGEIDTIMGNAAVVSGSEAHGYDNTTTAIGGYLPFAANPTGTANNENLSTPFVRWQVHGFGGGIVAPVLDRDYGYMYIPKIKQVANPADQDPDFTKYVNATPSMYTTGTAGSGTNLNSDANDSISFYILSEVQDGATWKVRGLQEKSAQTVTYPAVDTLPLIQIPPLPKIKHVQLSATTSAATAATAVAALNADIDESGTGGLNLRMQFDQSPYLNTGEARFANQFLIHVEIMEQNVSTGEITPYSGTVTHLKPTAGGSADSAMLALEEEDVFVGVYRHATPSNPGSMKKRSGTIVDLGTTGALYTAVSTTDSPTYYLAELDEALELFETKVQLSHSSPSSLDTDYTIHSTEATAVSQTEINVGSQKQLLAYVTLKLRTEADAYGAYRESELSAIDKAGTDAMDHFVEHSIVPVHLYVPSS
jgi:hypothetical protein